MKRTSRSRVVKSAFDPKRICPGLSKSAAIAESAGVLCEAAHASDAHPYKAILDTASAKGCDLIVMGSHGRRGVAGLLLGSETQKTLTHGKIPVLVYRE